MAAFSEKVNNQVIVQSMGVYASTVESGTGDLDDS